MAQSLSKVYVHITFSTRGRLPLIKGEIKKQFSKWIKTKGNAYSKFYWQNGYGIFSVNPSEIDVVIRYIENQETHHQKISFKDEYKAFLKKYTVDFKEEFLWD
jgi:hypothetical protein